MEEVNHYETAVSYVKTLERLDDRGAEMDSRHIQLAQAHAQLAVAKSLDRLCEFLELGGAIKVDRV